MTNPLQSYLDTVESRVEKATPELGVTREHSIKWSRTVQDANSDRTTLLAICRELREALEFYASEWGPHQGSPIKGVNQFTQNRLNESGEKAREALARAGEICMKIKEQ